MRDERLGATARLRIASNALELVHFLNDFPALKFSSEPTSDASIIEDEDDVFEEIAEDKIEGVGDDDDSDSDITADSFSLGVGNKVQVQKCFFFFKKKGKLHFDFNEK